MAAKSRAVAKPPRAGGSFPVVGVGASAGGLKALEEFFGHVSADSGMAYVVIQHLDPTQKAGLVDLLQRVTPMPVSEVREGVKLRAGQVYVIPPGSDMFLARGTLHLVDRTAAGLHLPIDFFLRSLAEDLGPRSVGVILSGMGSDGTLGLRAIKEAGGVVLVQDPLSAAFDSMPRSAIDAGLADLIAPAAALPGKLIAARQNMRPLGAAGGGHGPSALDKVVGLLRARTGNDFSYYKKNTLYRRLERRMGIHQIDRIDAYVDYLRDNPQELDLLFRELLIGVTNFFRDPEAWEGMARKAIAQLLQDHPGGRTLRAWVAGCSTGEEAYSLAIVFREMLKRLQPAGRFSLQIFATDLDADAIDRARQGFFQRNVAADVTPEGLAAYFVEEDGGYRVNRQIREMVTFAPQNIIMDPPFTKLDILCCRNLLIYLDTELQRKLMPLFHYSLNPGGILFLGSAETVGEFTDLFSPLDRKWRIYQRIGNRLAQSLVDFPTRGAHVQDNRSEVRRRGKQTVNLQQLAEQVLLQRFTPPTVLVNDKGDILHISGRTGRYLEPAAGKANWNIYAMARDGLRHELAKLLQTALRDKTTLTSRDIAVGSDGEAQLIDITAAAIDEPEELSGTAMVVFQELRARPPAGRAGRAVAAHGTAVQKAEREAHRLREELRTTREEMQSSQEELKSANEELQSTNEELQSTNEELSTSKEEMQSLNEELHVVNAELQSKVDDLSNANNDMQNLLNSTDIATIFLDDQLRVRRFTTQATRLFKLIPADVGRQLSDIVSDLDYPTLHDDALEVLRSLVYAERQVAASDGRSFQARIMPYRTQQNVISGLVITFTDITIAKRLEASLRQAVAARGDKDGDGR